MSHHNTDPAARHDDFTTRVRAAASWYLAQGIQPVPLRPGSKLPTEKGWQHLRVTEADIDRLFTPDSHIGLLLGAPSNGLIDVDLDCPEARRAAPYLLPPTDMISGRESAPDSHWWYVVDAPPERAAEPFDDPTGVRCDSTSEVSS